MVLNTENLVVTTTWKALDLSGADSITLILEGSMAPVKVRVANALPAQSVIAGITLNSNRDSICLGGLAVGQAVYVRTLSGSAEIAIS